MSVPEVKEKRVTWAELFFDLVFVFAITEVSALLHADHTWAGLGRALVIFVPIYWAWVGTSIHANTTDVDTPFERIGIFVTGLCALFMALAVPQAYGERGVLFGASYYAARLILAYLVFRGQPLTLRAFSIAAFVSGPLLLVGGFLDMPARVAVWALAALVDVSAPRIARGRLQGVRFHPEHLPERFGLFLIIALGESIVATGMPAATAPHLSAGMVAAVTAAFVLACGLWWVYYHYAASAILHALRTAAVQTEIIRPVLSYGHLAFIAGIVTMASGMAEVVAHPSALTPLPTAGLLYGGCALYLATFGYTRWRMFRAWAKTRLGAAAVVLVLLPVTPLLPALAALSLLAALIVALNVLEYLIVTRWGGL
ncbi:low temperature requirement protein A [Nonomuraea sediminis]|uniref:low temperature requirement protein A n=1 Tax=Nonomuraea sediminis TaxID=2835864 RepID=UPI001BDCF82E|nr:low temperature requirement protein A [Nonomuraea sediminis]